MLTLKRKDGFTGEKYIAIPETALKLAIRANPFMEQLYLTYIGYFPKAAFHYRERPEGCKDNILIYCIRGRGWFVLNGERFEVGPNEFILVPATREAMSYGADEQDPWTIYWIHFCGKDLDTFNTGFGVSLYDGAKQILENEKGLQLWACMHQQLELGYSSENLNHANLHLYPFLATFFYPEKHVDHKIQDEKDMIKETIIFFKENLHKKLTVEQMAIRHRLSVSHFSSLFRKATGMSPLDYFIHLKIRKACVLLSGSSQKVKDIAHTIGYEDAFHFSRLFKKNIQVSPHQYRMSRRKREERQD